MPEHYDERALSEIAEALRSMAVEIEKGNLIGLALGAAFVGDHQGQHVYLTFNRRVGSPYGYQAFGTLLNLTAMVIHRIWQDFAPEPQGPYRPFANEKLDS